MLDQPITLVEVSHVVKAIKNNKSAGSDGIVGELIKYEGEPMCEMLLALFNLVWVDNIFSLSELIQGRIREGKSTFSFFS